MARRIGGLIACVERPQTGSLAFVQHIPHGTWFGTHCPAFAARISACIASVIGGGQTFVPWSAIIEIV
jgi:hypothetical protein